MTARLALSLSALWIPCAADDVWPLSDEFDNAATFADWQDLGVVEGWHTPSYELANIDTTESGHFHIVPGAITWFNHLRGLLFFKEVTGDFIATTKVRVLSRHNPGDPTETPNRSFSLTGIFAHGPRAITQAAPDPYTTNAVWPPGDHGSDYVANTENYIFLSYGTAGNAGTRQFEVKATRNSQSRLYYDSTGIDQNETECWLQMVRIGDTVVCLRKHSENGDWIVENRYPNADHPFPAFGATLQVGITAYTDWPTASPFSGNVQDAYHFNYAPPNNGSPDLISQVDYFRLRRPDPSLTETMLQAMSVSYNPATNNTANPPVTLAGASAPYLGDTENLAYDPYGEWRQLEFGADAALPLADPESDPDLDGRANLIEFIFGSDPQVADAGNPLSLDSTSVSFTPAEADGAILVIERSLDLNTWDPVATRPLRGGDWDVSLTGAAAQVIDSTVTIDLPSSPERQFVRLSASAE